MSNEPKPQPLDVSWGSVAGLHAKPKTGSAKGVKTIWTLTPGEGNLGPEHIPPGFTPRLNLPEVVGADDGWANYLHVPRLGAQTYKVTAKLADSTVVKEVTIRTNRRIPVTVYYVSATALKAWEKAFALVTKALDAVGVTLEVEKKVKTDNAGPLFKGQDTKWMDPDGNWYGAPGESFSAAVAKLFIGERLPSVDPSYGHLRIFVLERLDLLWDVEETLEFSQARAWDYQDGEKIELLPSGNKNRLSQSPVLIAEANSVDLKAYARRVDDRHIKLVFPSTDWIDQKFPSDEEYPLKLRWEFVETGFLGWTNDLNLIAVATLSRTSRALSPEIVARSALHEIGHALTMVPEYRTLHEDGGTREKNLGFYYEGRHYTGMGGTGNHCGTNGKTDDGVMVRDRAKGKLCVMYHKGGESGDARVGFCAECAIDLKRVDNGSAGPRRTWT